MTEPLHDDWPKGISRPPTADELVLPPGEPMETQRHLLQMRLLQATLEVYWADRNDVFIGGDMFVYFSLAQTKKNDFRGPDVFIVTGTQRRERKAWLVWEEDGKLPDVVIELLSESTAEIDRGVKKDQYARVLRVPEYFVYDPFTGELEGWRLDAANLTYDSLPWTKARGMRSAIADLELRVWRGPYANVEAPWLRWFTADGFMLPTGEERASAETARANTEAARANAEAERANAEAERANAEAERARLEAQKRAEAEARAADLERRLAALERSPSRD